MEGTFPRKKTGQGYTPLRPGEPLPPMFRPLSFGKSSPLYTALVAFVASGVVFCLVVVFIRAGILGPPFTSMLEMRNSTCAGGPAAARWILDCDGVHLQHTTTYNGTAVDHQPITATTQANGETAVIINGDYFWVQTSPLPTPLIPLSANEAQAGPPSSPHRRESVRRSLLSVKSKRALEPKTSPPLIPLTPPDPIQSPAVVPLIMPQSFAYNSSFGDSGAFGVFPENVTMRRPVRIDVPLEADDVFALILKREARPGIEGYLVIDADTFLITASTGTDLTVSGPAAATFAGVGAVRLDSYAADIILSSWITNTYVRAYTSGVIVHNQFGGDSKVCFLDDTVCMKRVHAGNDLTLESPMGFEFTGGVPHHPNGESFLMDFVARAAVLQYRDTISGVYEFLRFEPITGSLPAAGLRLQSPGGIWVSANGGEMALKAFGPASLQSVGQAATISAATDITLNAGNTITLNAPASVYIGTPHLHAVIGALTFTGTHATIDMSSAIALSAAGGMSLSSGAGNLQFMAGTAMRYLPSAPDTAHFYQHSASFTDHTAYTDMTNGHYENNPQCLTPHHMWTTWITESSGPIGAPSACTRKNVATATQFVFSGAWVPVPSSMESSNDTVPPMQPDGSPAMVITPASASVAGAVNMTASLTVTDQIHGAAFTSPSDVRLKKDIVAIPASESVARINAIQPKKYKYSDEYVALTHATTQVVRGFIAQELESACPECVEEGPAFMGDGVAYKQVDKLRLMADVVGTLKSILARLDALESS